MEQRATDYLDLWNRLIYLWSECAVLYLCAHYSPSEGIAKALDPATKKRLTSDVEVMENEVESWVVDHPQKETTIMESCRKPDFILELENLNVSISSKKTTITNKKNSKQMNHILACCERWNLCYQHVFRFIQHWYQEMKQTHDQHLRVMIQSYKKTRRQLSEDFQSIVNEFVQQKSVLTRNMESLLCDWLRESRVCHQELVQWISNVYQFQKSTLHIINFRGLLPHTTNNESPVQGCDGQIVSILSQSETDLHAALLNLKKGEEEQQDFPIVCSMMNTVEHAIRQWNRSITPEVGRWIEFQKQRIRSHHTTLSHHVQQQQTKVDRLQQNVRTLMEEEQYHLDQSQSMDSLTKEKMQMNLMVQQAIAQVKPTWESESQLLELYQSQWNQSKSFHDSLSIHTSSSSLTSTKKTWKSLRQSMDQCHTRKQTIHTQFNEQLQQVLNRNQKASSLLMEKWNRDYLHRCRESQRLSAVMFQSHDLQFDKSYETSKVDILLLENHLAQYYHSVMTHPDLFDQVEFLSRTLTKTPIFTMEFVQQLKQELFMDYARQWIVQMKNLLENEGQL